MKAVVNQGLKYLAGPLGLLLAVVPAYGQGQETDRVEIRLQDQASTQAVEHADVLIHHTNGRVQYQVSDQSGRVVLRKVTFPLVVQISHLNYEPWQDTLYQVQTEPINLRSITRTMEEVVITGQFAPQSARHAVYKVRTIGADRLEAQGATTLQDVLRNELNVRFSRDNALGSSNLNLQGLSGRVR
ncbi:MAG: Plug domain-containing protein [Bacteroidia bacterium]|nr:Plug domain-containing protein [Bacteroidia bacterium]